MATPGDATGERNVESQIPPEVRAGERKEYDDVDKCRCEPFRTWASCPAVPSQTAGNRTTIAFPLTRKDVAEMCGTTLHTVSRILTAWEKAGLIATSRQRVTIGNPAEIRRLADEPPH